MIEFKGSHFEREVILWGVCWYVAYPISYRQPEEMMDERGVEVDHSTPNRWVLKYVPFLEAQFRARKRPDTPDQIPQQHRRAGSPSHQATDTTDAGVQILLVRGCDPRLR